MKYQALFFTKIEKKYKKLSDADKSCLWHHFGVTPTMCGSFVLGYDFVISSFYFILSSEINASKKTNKSDFIH